MPAFGGDDLTSILALAMPKAESVAPAVGTADKAARADHTHPRITWSGVQTTDAGGLATFDFSAKPFDIQPVTTIAYYEDIVAAPAAYPVILRVASWTMSNGKFTGCTIKASRTTPIPTNLVSLLAGGVYNLFNGSAAGIQINLVLIPQSGA